MPPAFHLSLGVRSIEDSVDFFVTLLRAKVLHRDPSGYVNLDFFGTQITLKQNPDIEPELRDFHFGVNLSLAAFDELSMHVARVGANFVHMKPEVWDAGTSLERKKMYLKCPTGYLVELKGYV
jgi:extradiol dioxygenase family protein